MFGTWDFAHAYGHREADNGYHKRIKYVKVNLCDFRASTANFCLIYWCLRASQMNLKAHYIVCVSS